MSSKFEFSNSNIERKINCETKLEHPWKVDVAPASSSLNLLTSSGTSFSEHHEDNKDDDFLEEKIVPFDDELTDVKQTNLHQSVFKDTRSWVALPQESLGALNKAVSKPVDGSYLKWNVLPWLNTKSEKTYKEINICATCGAEFDNGDKLADHCILFHKPEESLQVSSSDNAQDFKCSVCNSAFSCEKELVDHAVAFHESSLGQDTKDTEKNLDSKVKTNHLGKDLGCIKCNIKAFKTNTEFKQHHIDHIKNSIVCVQVNYLGCGLGRGMLETESSTRSGSPSADPQDNPQPKLTLKISRAKPKGRTKHKFHIVNKEGMSDTASPEDNEAETGEQPYGESSHPRSGSNSSENSRDGTEAASPVNSEPQDVQHDGQKTARPGEEASLFPDAVTQPAERSYNTFSQNGLSFDRNDPLQRPPSTYQPQFESFTGDWFSDYESGPRIAAALAGATSHSPSSAEGTSWNGDAPVSGQTEDHNSSADKTYSQQETGERDGLFSQEMLGSLPPSGEHTQGSFEELCLNDSFNQGEQSLPGSQGQPVSGQGFPGQIEQSSGDLLSELDYLNSSSQPHPSALAIGDNQLNSRSPVSAVANAAGHPTPPPSDTSFRALATSPTSPVTGGHTPPITASSALPGQQTGLAAQAQVSQQEEMNAPRLTIANNLMAPSVSEGSTSATPVLNYQQQWPSPGTNGNAFGASYVTGNNLGQIRGTVAPGLPVGYRPSPPPRIRGRPPLVGGIARPTLHPGSIMRGPGRPPGGSTLPAIAPGTGGRGMMPSLQRMPQNLYPSGQRQQGQKRVLSGSPQQIQSPSKMRREDINVPCRQKDTDCQIIAVANRADGIPVISSVQGGSREDRPARSSPNSNNSASSSESTIHLSDSITLSVRSNSSQRNSNNIAVERGGPDAGVVANLLASRGITVTPAAGEKPSDSSGGGTREERRLPSASELNLSSAISVHPPTSRDRDGFAVPQPVSRGAVANNSVERPPRPPTVDLTLDVPVAGYQGTRVQCSQCDRTFPSQALLADHAKMHQQQQSQRMPFRCHLCTAGFSTQKSQQNHYQQFHQLHLSVGDVAIPLVDFRNSANIQRMVRMGIRSFLPLSSLQNRGAGGAVGIPILTLENLHNGQNTLQQWGVTDVITLGPPRTLNMPR